jgi:serine protease inhibitor
MIASNRKLLLAGIVALAGIGTAAVLIFNRPDVDGDPVASADDIEPDPEPLPDADPNWKDSKQAVTANNDFAFDLYIQLAREKSNRPLFFSPFSISNALVIVAEGACKETADEMGKALRFPETTRRTGADAAERPWNLGMIHAGLALLRRQLAAASGAAPKEVRARLASLRKQLQTANEAARKSGRWENSQKAVDLANQINRLQAKIDRYELRVANSLWGEKSYPFKQAYLDTIGKYYGASAFGVDFRHDFEAARKRINAWVEERTRDRIKHLIPAEALNRNTTLVVANAMYFKGQWSSPFNAEETADRPFTLADGGEIQLPTMHGSLRRADRYGAFKKDGTFFDTPMKVVRGSKDTDRLYPDRDGFEIIELPYKGEAVSMAVIVPRSADGLPALENRLSGQALQTWLNKLQQRAINVFLPKFKMESSFDLNKTLGALGMRRAFRRPVEKDGAQLDGLSDAKGASEQLYVSLVLHKAFVDVSEKGTEAAAATMVGAKDKGKDSMWDTEPFTPTFRADKPFVFLIRDQKTGAILFLGRVMNPKTGG